MTGGDACGLGAESGGAEADFAEVEIGGCFQFFGGEIAFGSDEHTVGSALGYGVLQVQAIFRVDKGDALLFFLAVLYNFSELQEVVFDKREHRFYRLLHSADGDFFQAIGFDKTALGVFTVHEADLVHTEFGGFFDEPLNAIGIFGGGDGDVYVEIFLWRFIPVVYFKEALAGVGFRDDGIVKKTKAIGDVDRVARFCPQHFYTMPGFISIEIGHAVGNTGLVEEVHLAIGYWLLAFGCWPLVIDYFGSFIIRHSIFVIRHCARFFTVVHLAIGLWLLAVGRC
jgi:hypothetical protein